jgi:hypothetical protein
MARNYSSISEIKTLAENVPQTGTNSDKVTVAPNTTGLPAVPFVLVLNPDTSNEEAVLATSLSGSTYTVTRNIEGGGLKTHTAQQIVKHMIVGSDLQIVHDHFSQTDTSNTSTVTAHGVTGGVVGRTNTQTLTNKTLTAPTITSPVITGGTINGGAALTVSSTELNVIDGITASTAELNILDGVTTSTAELNYVDGVTSAIQTQLNTKAPIANPTFTGTVGGVTKGMVGLGNVDNTSDLAKPISTATQSLITAVNNSANSNIASLASSVGDDIYDVNQRVNTKFNTSGGRITGPLEVDGSATFNNAVDVSGTNLRIDGDVVRVASGGQGTTPSNGGLSVTHNLGRTPTGVTCTQRSSTGFTNSQRIFVITDIGSTTFNVYAMTAAGVLTSGAFYWTAVG